MSVAAETCAAVPAWWLSSRLLLGRRVAWRLLFPGAVVSGLAQVLFSSAVVGAQLGAAVAGRDARRGRRAAEPPADD